MIDIISDLNAKARRVHACSFCGKDIRIGEVYHKQVLKCDDLYTWKSHLYCDELVRELKMIDDFGEGITEQEFHDYVWDFYINFHPEYKPKTATWTDALLFTLSSKGLLPEYYLEGGVK